MRRPDSAIIISYNPQEDDFSERFSYSYAQPAIRN
jgi:hypothetical protein